MKYYDRNNPQPDLRSLHTYYQVKEKLLELLRPLQERVPKRVFDKKPLPIWKREGVKAKLSSLRLKSLFFIPLEAC